jgi:NADPH-dependent 2,4-dienoyl-CoA reductase/sulfur reductase-like enzyme/rhodanese-related sulfurtransferase
VASPEVFKERFNIEVRTEHEVIAIDRARRELEVRNLQAGDTYRQPYTKLVLSPGATAIVPPLPGVDLPGVFVLRTIPDSRRIREWIDLRAAKRAVVVGAGFIGLETAENLARRGLDIAIVEMGSQVMPPLDPEMAVYVEERLRERRVDLHLGDGLAGIVADGGTLVVKTASGARVPADLVLLAIGVRPEVKLARNCGLALGTRGGIQVDAQMRTNDPDIFAVGDAVDATDVVTGGPVLVPLAGPANRQGRIAADAISERSSKFRGVQATAVCGVFDLTVAMTGASEKALTRAGYESAESVYLHPGHHVGYFPGARPIHLKLTFDRRDGRILGAQAIGEEGAERRMDVIAMAMQKGGTVYDLEEAELCYAPQYGAAKDPVNLAGMVAANVLRGDQPLAHWRDLETAPNAFVLDVREEAEYASGHVDGAVNIPLSKLRQRLDELPRDREIWMYCAVGQRAYYATRTLSQRGLEVRNLSGGYASYQAHRAAGQG